MGVTADFMGTAQEDKSAMHAIVSGQVQCILASPETILNNQMAQDMLQSPIYQRYLAAVVIDEAHCISHWLVACQYTNQYSKASIHAKSLITRYSRLQEPLHHLCEEFDTETAASATSILQQKHSGPNLNKDIRVGANSLHRGEVFADVGRRSVHASSQRPVDIFHPIDLAKKRRFATWLQKRLNYPGSSSIRTRHLLRHFQLY